MDAPHTPRPGRTRVNDPAGLRGKVLDVAARLFQSQGYNATTMQEITAGAGATGGGLNHHFRSKKAIGLAVLRERVAPAVAETWIAPLTVAASAAEGVRAVFGAIAAELDAKGAVQGCPLNNLALELSLADADFRAEIAQVFTAWRRAVADRLRADQAVGGAAGLDADAFAVFVVSAYSGAMAMSKADQSSEALRLCGRELVRALEGGTSAV
jgi:AcrR family transcriptional regulator